MLETVLSEAPPPSMKVVAGRLGLSLTTLYKHFPGLCRAIAGRHVSYREACFAEIKEQLRSTIKEAALRILSEGAYPSVKRVQVLVCHLNIRSNQVALSALREITKGLGPSLTAQVEGASV